MLIVWQRQKSTQQTVHICNEILQMHLLLTVPRTHAASRWDAIEIQKPTNLIVAMGFLNSFRDGIALNLRQLDISDAVLLVCRCTWAERTIPTRWDNSIYISFYQFNVLFHIRIASLWWLFFGEIGTHTNVLLLQFGRIPGWVLMYNNETCNAAIYLGW